MHIAALLLTVLQRTRDAVVRRLVVTLLYKRYGTVPASRAPLRLLRVARRSASGRESRGRRVALVWSVTRMQQQSRLQLPT